MSRHAAIYTRLSKDRTGRGENVAAQERRGRQYAAQHWPDLPVEVYCDNDASAADDAAPRPDFLRLRAAIVSGEVAHVWAVEQSRLTRSRTGWFEFEADLLAAGLGEVHTDRDGVVRLDEVAGIKAVLNGAEVRRLRQRVNAKLDDLAAEGRPPGGRTYGYRHVVDEHGRKALEVIDEEAEHARWAAGLVLSGWSLSNIVRELEARGAPTARGGRWATATVRSVLMSPTIAGYRVHRGEIVGRGTWDPIIDEATWQQVRARLTAPRDVQTVDGRTWHVSGRRSTARRYLLTGGLAVCGRCSAPLIAQNRSGRQGQRSPAYLCHRSRGGCNGIGIGAEQLEAHVADRLLAELDRRPSFGAALAADGYKARRDVLTAKLVEVERRRADGAGMWARGELTQAEWQEARAVLAAEQERLTADLSAVPAPPDLAFDVTTLREGWALMTLDERRQVIDVFVERVEVAPAEPGTRKFDPDRVTIVWRRT